MMTFWKLPPKTLEEDLEMRWSSAITHKRMEGVTISCIHMTENEL
jgi:hypothetical protein